MKLNYNIKSKGAKRIKHFRRASLIVIIVATVISTNISCFNVRNQPNVGKNESEILHDYDIAFLSNREESRSDIYLLDTPSQQKINITENLNEDRYNFPVFISDNKIIFFNEDRTKLFLSDLNKKKTALILESKDKPIVEYNNYCIDKKREELLISEENGLITYINLNTGQKRSAKSEIGQFKYPSFSPDYSLIAVRKEFKNNSLNGNLYLISPDGKKVSQLTEFTSSSNYPFISVISLYCINWTFDGKRIFFNIINSSGAINLAMIDISTNRLTIVTNIILPSPDINNLMYGFHYFYLSPNGNGILAQANFSDYTWSKNYDYISMNSDGSNIINLTDKYPELKDLFECYWSRDSKRIAFVTNKRNGEIELITMNPDGSDVIKNDLSFEGIGNEWSTDGKKFVYPESSPIGYQVFMTSTKGTKVDNISNGLVVGGDYPDLRGYGFQSPWTKDGNKIGIQIFHPNRINELDDYRIFIIEKSGNIFEIPNIRDDFPWNPCWSPDGKEILYEYGAGRAKDEDVYITDLKGNKRILKKSRGLAGFAAGEQYAFWLDNGKICYYAQPPPEKDYQKRLGKKVATMDVFLINPDGNNEFNLTKDLYLTWFPIWNYDHSKFIFTDKDEKDKLFVYNVKKKKVTSVIKDFANLHTINTFYCWSYDNKTFYATNNTEANCEILALNTDNGRIEKIYNGTENKINKISDIVSSPNKRYISFVCDITYKIEKNEKIIKEIAVYDLFKKEFKQITGISPNLSFSKPIKEKYGNFNPQFTPDSSKIVFESNIDGNNEIYIVNVDGTGLKNLSNSPANDTLPKICPMPKE